MFALLIAVVVVLWIVATVIRFGDDSTIKLHVNQALADENRRANDPVTTHDDARAA